MSIDTPENIVKQYSDTIYAIKSANIKKLLFDIRAFENTGSCYAFGEFLHATFVQNDDNSKTDLLKYLSEKEYSNIELKQIKPTIEDCFIKLMATSE